MIKENSFINTIKDKENITPRQEWMFRQSFRRMTNAEKKRHDSDYVREKNKLKFSEWFELIGENIDQGHQYHERNKNNISVSNSLDKRRAQLNDPEYRNYLNLPPLEDNELDSIKSTFEENTELEYPSLEYLEDSDDEEILDVTQEIAEVVEEQK